MQEGWLVPVYSENESRPACQLFSFILHRAAVEMWTGVFLDTRLFLVFSLLM